MIYHLIGNGPSRVNFDPALSGDKFGCNLSDFALDLKATFVTDYAVIERMVKDGIVMPWPMIVTENIVDHIHILPEGNVYYDWIAGRPEPGESTGHIAFKYLVKRKPNEIHLWGMDSITANTMESDSHTKIPEGGWSIKNLPKWQDRWANLIGSAETLHDISVVVHK